MLESRLIDTTKKEGRTAQRMVLSLLAEIKRLLLADGIEIWCVNRYSYRATIREDAIDFEIYFPKATDAEHEYAVNKIISVFPNVIHVKRGLDYFRQLLFNEGDCEDVQNPCAVCGTDMHYEFFSIPFDYRT